jgi:hypothetical protein
MKNNLNYLTKEDLKALGFSTYLIQSICKGLPFVYQESKVKGYNYSELKEAIMQKLSQAKIKPQTRENLQIALSLLDDKSNVIEVDFLNKLTLEERIEFIKNNREVLRNKGETLLRDIDELIKQAKTLV